MDIIKTQLNFKEQIANALSLCPIKKNLNNSHSNNHTMAIVVCLTVKRVVDIAGINLIGLHKKDGQQAMTIARGIWTAEDYLYITYSQLTHDHSLTIKFI